MMTLRTNLSSNMFINSFAKKERICDKLSNKIPDAENLARARALRKYWITVHYFPDKICH